MLCWLTGELLIAAVIVVIACRMRRYWLGGVLVFLLWPLFSWLVPSQDSMMYALPFVVGVPAIIVWRGRALPPEEKACLAEKYAYLREPCPAGAFIFGVLFIVSLLWMLASWEIYDLAGGRLSVERRTWWGLAAQRREWSVDQVAKVEVVQRLKPMRRGGRMKVDDIVFSGADGKPLFRSARSVWSANDYARRLNEELKRSDCGTFHEWTLVRQECWPGPFAFLLMTWFLSRGIGSRPKKRKSARVFSHSPNGISLGSVLTQVGKQ